MHEGHGILRLCAISSRGSSNYAIIVSTVKIVYRAYVVHIHGRAVCQEPRALMEDECMGRGD